MKDKPEEKIIESIDPWERRFSEAVIGHHGTHSPTARRAFDVIHKFNAAASKADREGRKLSGEELVVLFQPLTLAIATGDSKFFRELADSLQFIRRKRSPWRKYMLLLSLARREQSQSVVQMRADLVYLATRDGLTENPPSPQGIRKLARECGIIVAGQPGWPKGKPRIRKPKKSK